MNRFQLVQPLIGILMGVIEVLTGLEGQWLYDCQAIKDCGFNESGVYHVTPIGTSRRYTVYCDMTTENGGWLVFQRRKDGSVNFYRGWEDYQFGFGDPTREVWLGNLALHILTRQGHYEMRIDLEDWEGNSRFAKYKIFRLESAKDMYTLRVFGYSGDAGDDLFYHNGIAFSTTDKDNDRASNKSCAVDFNGSWWYKGCHVSNLNGLYLKGIHTSYANGVNWKSFRGHYYSLKTTEMKIRRI